jgi:hypothetical protein
MDGYRAAGPVVMVIEEGSIWVLDQHGTQQELSAPGVVIWDTGEWVEYGSENPARTAYYWAPRVSDTGFHPCSPDDARQAHLPTGRQRPLSLATSEWQQQTAATASSSDDRSQRASTA